MFFSEISLSFCTVYALQKLVVHVSLFTWKSVSVNWRSWQGYQFAVCVRSSSHNYSGVRASQHCYCSIYRCTVWPAVAHDFTAGNRVTSSEWLHACFFLHICMKDFCTAVAFLEIISVYFPVQKHLRPLGKQNLQNRRSFTMWILAGFFHVCFVSSVSFMWLMREI